MSELSIRYKNQNSAGEYGFGSVSASEKKTLGKSWKTSEDNQNFPVNIRTASGEMKTVYVTQKEGEMLLDLAKKGYKITDNNGNQVIINDGENNCERLDEAVSTASKVGGKNLAKPASDMIDIQRKTGTAICKSGTHNIREYDEQKASKGLDIIEQEERNRGVRK